MVDLENSEYQIGKFRKFTHHKSLNEGWRYFKLVGTDALVGIRINIPKMYFVVEEDGTPVLSSNHLPVIEWSSSTQETKLITKEEYDSIKKSGFEE